MASPPNKIVLKSTTKISLNDRFAAIRRIAESTVNAIRQRMRQSRQASSKNLRLVQQMENRPSVIAALKLKKRSLKQRLDTSNTKSNVKARLTLGARRGRGGGRGVPTSPPRGIAGRGTRGSFRLNRQPMRDGNNRGGARRGRGTGGGGRLSSPLSIQRMRNLYVSSRGAQNSVGNGRGRGRKGPYMGARGGGFRSRYFGPGGRRPRGGFGGPAGRRFRGERGSRGGGIQRGAGLRGGWSRRRVLPSRQQLDTELDEYMSKSRGGLDTEIDSYMAQAHD